VNNQPGSSRPDQSPAVARPHAAASEHGYLPELPAVLRSVQVDRLLDGGLKLRHFVLVSAIERNHSVVHAAEELHVTQPAVTRALRELETNLGVELFERGPRGMTATVFGIAFLQHAEAILGEVHQLGRHLTDLTTGQAGTVSVGTYLAGSNVLLPQAIAAFKACHPMVIVEVVEQTFDILVQSLLSGAMDLIVSRLTPTGLGDRLTQIGMYTEPVRLVVRAGHPAVGRPALDIEVLLGYPWILPQQRTALRREVEQAFLALGLPLPANRVESASILTLRALLLASNSVAVLPALIAEDDPELHALTTPMPTIVRTVGVTLRTGGVLTAAAEHLLAELKNRAEAIRAHLDDHPCDDFTGIGHRLAECVGAWR